MDLTHRVRVPAPVEEAWEVVNDPSRLATVLPGALVDAAAEDTFSGTWKIKLSSTVLALAGTGRYASRDAEAHRVVIETDGSDRRGDAGVRATHTLTLTTADDDAHSTEVMIETAMTWTGRPARLGSGVVADAVDRVLEQAGSRIAARVSEGLPWIVPAADVSAADDELTAEAVLDHAVELGSELGAVDEAAGAAVGARRGSSPSPSPGPAPRTPAPSEPSEYVWKPFTTTAQPHVESARTLTRVLGTRVLPYAGLAALAVFAAASAVRRARR